MHILKIIVFAGITITTHATCMQTNESDEHDIEKGLLTHADSSASVVNRPPLVHGQLFEHVVRAEKKAIYEASTFNELESNIARITPDYIKQSVNLRINCDIKELKETIQKLNTSKFDSLIQRSVGGHFYMPENKPVLAHFSNSRCPTLASFFKPKYFTFSEDFKEHVNDQLNEASLTTIRDALIHFKRIQLYSEHLYTLAKKESINAVAKEAALVMGGPLTYVPFEITSFAKGDLGTCTLLLTAHLLSIITAQALAYKTDITGYQSARHITDTLFSLHHISAQASAELDEHIKEISDGTSESANNEEQV